ncbi:MAG: TIGR03118 family protein [Betaproteobacteria bacterium]|nr:TIGR03118 family protein [Betaproteobacteria bacterium]
MPFARQHPCIRSTAYVLVLLGTTIGMVDVASAAYTRTDLVADQPGAASLVDPHLVNAWGLSYGPGGPFWISANGTGETTVYDGSGATILAPVSIPPLAGSSPTGQVFNGGSGFGGSIFLFGTEEGAIAGWNGGASALTLVDNGGSGAIYKGLALAGTGQEKRLYAADFHNGRIDSFASDFTSVLPGAFVDPTLPSGYAPFNIQNLGGTLYVAYALQDAAGRDEVAGAGLGIVDAFDGSGNLLRRVATGGALDAPWGLALAPTDFGEFGTALLVGNFGDGLIHAYDPVTGALLGTMLTPQATPIVIDGLWGILFGNGGSAGSTSDLYFAAGPDGEAHGLFGRLSVAAAVPEPEICFELTLGIGLLAVTRRRVLSRSG